MDMTKIHELAEEFSGVHNPDATLTEIYDPVHGTSVWKVELSSDITVYVDGDTEECNF